MVARPSYAFIDKRRKVIFVAFLNISPPPVIARDSLPAERRTTATWTHYPVGMCYVERVILGEFFACGDLAPCHDRNFIAQPEIRVT